MKGLKGDTLSGVIAELFGSLESSEIKSNIESRNFSYFNSAIRFEAISEFSNFWDEVYWFAEAKAEIEREDHPCLHVAFACSAASGPTMEKQHGMYSIFQKSSDGALVISNCPWCGTKLPTSLVASAPNDQH